MAGFDEDEIEFTGDDEDINLLELEKASEDAPVVRLVNMILLNAIKKGASDIHIEPYEKKLRVRYRIDGVLSEEMTPPLKLKNAITSRIKIMASLDIAERRLPQDGRIKLKLGKGREMDFRVSVLPTIWGEKVVMRLLDKGNLQLDMTKLGFDPKPLEDFMWAIHQPWGMVLVTGPTGSGKTTTLYSALSRPQQDRPQHQHRRGSRRVQPARHQPGADARRDRPQLRRWPCARSCGRTRTSSWSARSATSRRREIAVKAALTGHMVLSTLHTNDAPATISRLLNMGVEPFLITASVNLVLAQRLARKICADCKQPAQVRPEGPRGLRLLAGADRRRRSCMKGAGCRTCNGTGYKGRVALYEVMRFTDALKEMVLQGASTAELKIGADQERDEHAARERYQEGHRRRDDARGGRARHDGGLSRWKQSDRMRQPSAQVQPAPASQGDDREGRERHAHHDGLAAAAAHRRRHRPAQAPAARPGRDQAALLLGAHRGAARAVREDTTSSTSPSA